MSGWIFSNFSKSVDQLKGAKKFTKFYERELLFENNLGICWISEGPECKIYSKAENNCLAVIEGEVYWVDSNNKTRKDIYEAYRYYGDEFIMFLHGDFSLLFYDKKNNIIFIIRDPSQIHPLYISKKGNEKYWSTRALPLSILINGEPKIDEEGLAEFAWFHTQLSTKTMYKKVFRPYGILAWIIRNGSIKEISLNERGRFKNRANFSIEQAFLYSVSARIDKDSRNGTLLSGGYESRVVTAALHKQNSLDSIFTWGHPKSKEALLAKRIANRIGVKWQLVRPDATHLDIASFLEATEGQLNLQYAYRFTAIKMISQNNIDDNIDALWSGWAEPTGSPCYPSELISPALAYYIQNEQLPALDSQYVPIGWDKDWLKNFIPDIPFPIPDNKFEGVLLLANSILRQRIFGAMRAAESQVIKVCMPWLDSLVDEAMEYEESKLPLLKKSRNYRSTWRRQTYERILRKSNPYLDWIPVSDGYPPIIFYAPFTLISAPIAYILAQRRRCRKGEFFDPVEDVSLIKTELQKIAECGYPWLDNDVLYKIVKSTDAWNGYFILELLKIIGICKWFERIRTDTIR